MGNKGAGFASALCFVAILKSPVPSLGMKTPGEEGTVPGGPCVCTAPHPTRPTKEPTKEPTKTQ